MADAAKIARLADSVEFAELKTEFEEREEKAIAKLGRQIFNNPELHDRIEAERLRAYYQGATDVLELPRKSRATLSRKDPA